MWYTASDLQLCVTCARVASLCKTKAQVGSSSHTTHPRHSVDTCLGSGNCTVGCSEGNSGIADVWDNGAADTSTDEPEEVEEEVKEEEGLSTIPTIVLQSCTFLLLIAIYNISSSVGETSFFSVPIHMAVLPRASDCVIYSSACGLVILYSFINNVCNSIIRKDIVD
jgi:hypothetical protein